METHTTSDRTTWKDWAVTLVAFACIALGIPAIAAMPDLGVALLLASILAITILVATRIVGRRTR